MHKVLAYPFTVFFYLMFGFWLCLFHPIQWVCLKIGYQAHKKSVDYLNWFIIRTLHVLGTSYIVKGLKNIPTNVPVIFVANHQSMYDIPPMIWFFRKAHAKFISKKELGQGIPSVSFNLRHGGSVLIDRKDAKQSIDAIKQMAVYIETHCRSVVIFPEGTRSRDGSTKPFKTSGLKTLFKHAPNAHIVPVSIQNSWKLIRFGSFPMGLGIRVKFYLHPSFPVASADADSLIEKTEALVNSQL